MRRLLQRRVVLQRVSMLGKPECDSRYSHAIAVVVRECLYHPIPHKTVLTQAVHVERSIATPLYAAGLRMG